MGLVLTTPPTVEPVSIAEAVDYLRVDLTNIDPPPTAPTVAPASPAAPGNVDNGVHHYRVTFVTAAGETVGGSISGPVTVADKTINGQVSLTAIPLGATEVTARKVYRTLAGGSAYFLLTTIANNTATSYTDNTADSGLGAGEPSTNTAVDNTGISSLIVASRQEAEQQTGASFLTQTWTATRSLFPWWHQPIPLSHGPVQSITSITYIDNNGTLQTLDPALYVLDNRELSDDVGVVFGQQWPAARHQLGSVTIEYVAGYGDSASDVPKPIGRAMLLRVGDLYRNREAQIIERAVAIQNEAFVSLLGAYTRTMRSA